MSFVRDDRGWIVGNHRSIVHTADGGQTWSEQPTGLSGSVIWEDAQFIDENTGWIVGRQSSNGFILHTADGGAIWTQQAGVFGTLSSIIGAQSVRFTDAQHGRIVGTVGLMAETRDGGETWTALEFGNGINSVVTSNPLHAIHLFDFNTGWAVGGTGTILRLGDLPDTIDLLGPALRAETIFLDGTGGVGLTWTPGEAEWSLESTRDLAGNEWDDVEHGNTPGQGEVAVELLTDGPQRCFRLRRSGGP